MPRVFSDGLLATSVVQNPTLVAGPAIAIREAVRRAPIAGQVELALANGTYQPVLGFAAAAAAPLASVEVQMSGPMDGFVGLVAGATYYLDQVTPGAIALSLPTSGEIQVVGVATSTTTLFIAPYFHLSTVLRSDSLSLYTGIHTTTSTGFQSVARQVVDFSTVGSSVTFRFFQAAVPAGNAEVRIFNVTDTTTLGSLTVTGTGQQSFAVTNPGGTKLIRLENRRIAGAGSSDIEGGSLSWNA